MNKRNLSLRTQIKELYKQRESISYGNSEYQRITKEIEILSLQIETDYHWSTSIGFYVSIIAMIAACLVAYPVVESFINKDEIKTITINK